MVEGIVLNAKTFTGFFSEMGPDSILSTISWLGYRMKK